MVSGEYARFKKLTSELLEKNELAYSYFQKYSLNKTSGDFLLEVKPFADEVKQNADEWLEETIPFINRYQPKYLHQSQIDDAYENMEIQSVACFQADTKRKRFVERNKSIKYTLELLVQAMEEK